MRVNDRGQFTDANMFKDYFCFIVTQEARNSVIMDNVKRDSL